MEELWQLHNVSGDLLKLVKGEDVEVPASFENMDAYRKHLLAEHQSERDGFYITKLQPKIDEKIEDAKKKQYPAIANPVFNRIKTYGDFSDDELKGKNISDAVEMFYNRMSSKVEEAQSTGSKTKDEYLKDIQEKTNKITHLNTELDRLRLEKEKEVEQIKSEYQKRNEEYIHDDLFAKSVMKIQDDCTLKGDTLIATLKYGLNKRGYYSKVDGKKLILVGDKDQTMADLSGTKNAVFDEVLMQVVEAEGVLKKSYTVEGHSAPNGGNPITSRRNSTTNWK